MAPRAPNSKKLAAIEYLASGGHSFSDIAAAVDVEQCTLRKWRSDPEFAGMVIERARELLKEQIPAIYSALSAAAARGSHQHAKIVLDHLEKLEQLRLTAVNGTVTFTWSAPDGVGLTREA